MYHVQGRFSGIWQCSSTQSALCYCWRKPKFLGRMFCSIGPFVVFTCWPINKNLMNMHGKIQHPDGSKEVKQEAWSDSWYVRREDVQKWWLRKKSQSMWIRHMDFLRGDEQSRVRHSFLSVLQDTIYLFVHRLWRPLNIRCKWLTMTVTNFPGSTSCQISCSTSVFERVSVRCHFDRPMLYGNNRTHGLF
jgi:hypothetical protein